MSFENLWKASIRYRHASRELEPLLRLVHESLAANDVPSLKGNLLRLLEYLAGDQGRTDANCATVHYFFEAAEPLWKSLQSDLRVIFDDMSGTLRESIYAPHIARTFDSTPEQLLERVRALG
ncbi:MAG TPA: hypothetical protein VF701_10085 [Thermoanaerobaculia bacterium]